MTSLVKLCQHIVSSNSYLLEYRDMAGRNDCAIVDALEALAHAMGNIINKLMEAIMV